MKIIVDDKIPFIKEAIEKIADEVVYAPGKDFTPSLVKDADALIIRTRTRCNRELLKFLSPVDMLIRIREKCLITESG